MTPKDVKNYYGSQYNFRKVTGMSSATLGNWLKWGYVPEDAQYKLERITKGALKTEWTKKMNEEASEHIYMLYKRAKRLIERTEACCEKDHSHESMFIEWKEAIRIFDGLGRGYAERYEKEKQDAVV